MNRTKARILDLEEHAGWLLGFGIGVFTGAISWVRRARMFHPTGILLVADVQPLVASQPGTAPFEGDISRVLTGKALIRLSGGWWKNEKEWIDNLGCAIRLTDADEITPDPIPGDQDLLFATMKRVLTTLLAPLTTNTHDYLANDYFAVAPFQFRSSPLFKLRLRPLHPVLASGNLSRLEKLERAVEHGEAAFILELRELADAGAEWVPVARIELREFLDLDQARLRFNPFNVGRGLRPRGFIQYLRIGAYKMSQAARPGTEALTRPKAQRSRIRRDSHSRAAA